MNKTSSVNKQTQSSSHNEHNEEEIRHLNVSSSSWSSSYHSSNYEQNNTVNNAVTEQSSNLLPYDATRYIMSKGYKPSKFVAKTLQGSIWNGINCNIDEFNGIFNRNIVVKITNRNLHSSKITVLDGKKVEVEENIISEMKILKYLTYNGIYFGLTEYMVSYIDFFYDEINYFLIMENGGTSLFDFVLKGHRCIESDKLSIIEWQNVCKILFNQMITFIDILHNKMNVCHLDISLENMLINDVIITVDALNNDKIHFVNHQKISVKFCDFGLSEMFDIKTNPNFLSSKFVGKTNYKSPEIYAKKKKFDARAADTWSLGVCLFALLIGSMPFNKPSINDPSFQWIITGNIANLLNQWKKLNYINQQSLDILFRIFQKEEKRINIKQLLKHPWFQ